MPPEVKEQCGENIISLYGYLMGQRMLRSEDRAKRAQKLIDSYVRTHLWMEDELYELLQELKNLAYVNEVMMRDYLRVWEASKRVT